MKKYVCVWEGGQWGSTKNHRVGAFKKKAKRGGGGGQKTHLQGFPYRSTEQEKCQKSLFYLLYIWLVTY